MRALVPEDLGRYAAAERDKVVGRLYSECVLRARAAIDQGNVTRAATSPTRVSDLTAVATVTVRFFETLTAFSAGADLLSRGLVLEFNGAPSISFPAISAGEAAFVQEGLAFPVQKFTVTPGNKLEPAKLGTLATLTSEMILSSNAEAIVRQALLDSVGPGLDKVLFSAAAAVPELKPAGLLNGITPLTASAATNKSDAMVEDLTKLTAAVAVVAGKSSVVFVVNPAQAIALALRLVGAFSYSVLPSNALAAGTVIAIATNGLVAAFGAAPTIDVSKGVTYHESDTPLPLNAGAPAWPTRDLYQTDCIGLKLRWPVSWVVRDARAVAHMSAVLW